MINLAPMNNWERNLCMSGIKTTQPSRFSDCPSFLIFITSEKNISSLNFLRILFCEPGYLPDSKTDAFFKE